MTRIEVGDLVRRVLPGDGIRINGQFYPHVYRVARLSDHHPAGEPVERGVVAHLVTLADDPAGTALIWDVEVVQSAKQRELEKLRVAVGRLAQCLGLNHRVPGNHNPRDFSYQALCRQAKVEDGWQALVALCIQQVDDLKRGH